MRIPKVIYIETTNKCNANCIMCPHDKLLREIETMDQKLFCKIVDGMKNFDLSQTQIFLHKEGEPLCDDEIASKINYMCRNISNFKEIGINTNAMLLTKEKTEKLLNSGLNLIFFSLDGVKKESYERIRINCNYEKVVSNIEYFLEERKKYKKNIRVIMQMLITDFNESEKEAYINKWSKYDVEFYFKEVHCYLDGSASSFSEPHFATQTKICEDPFRMLVYYVDGNVGCCCWDYNNEYIIGNANEQNLWELFNNSKIDYMRKMQESKSCKNIVPCNRCGRIFGEDKISEY